MFAQQTDRSWEAYGRDDPYYGVFPLARFRRENLTPAVLDEFFAHGETHVQALRDRFREHFGITGMQGIALDFGCGVGRIVAPLAPHFDRVIGVDISPGMLAEARKNCSARGLGNITLVRTLDEIPIDTPLQLVHSYIVLQHIDLPRAAETVEELLERLSPGGIAALHVTVGRDESLLRQSVGFLRRHMDVVNIPINLLRGRRWNDPFMEMNNYGVDRLLRQMERHAEGDVLLTLEWHQDYLGAMALMRKRKQPVAG